MSNPRTVVVIATYNEAETIQGILEALTDYHVIVVDDSSPDGTGDLARAYEHVTVISRPSKLGIASAYITGIKAALEMGAQYVVQMDAGGTHSVHDALFMLHEYVISQGFDLCIGSRFAPPNYPYSVERAGSWRTRALISRGAALLMRLLGIAAHDVTSGLRVWRATLLQKIDLNRIAAHGFAFQIEMLYQAHRSGAKILEYAIDYRLTNSTFRPWMLWEGLRTWARLALSR